MAYEGILLGMGNPLLDISSVVDEEFLQSVLRSGWWLRVLRKGKGIEMKYFGE
ncbi:hypothetical protein CK203_036684 [Vitis vinifera]|uniref:Adenosine kinase n=1 Tax=Vitis vinifera TaxID=29760 RepID=A0A438HIJ6_VITVI|nr:hypothetical protein CK203_036684 [Vitis vinifera]